MNVSLFDQPPVDAVTTEAIERVKRNAEPKWLKAALDAITSLALEQNICFTTDDVWHLLEVGNVEPPREPRAMGAVMRTAQGRGIIRATEEYRKSTRVECHGRPVMIWRKAT
jgi:hypothetical protein